jgi:hypothetical protein
MSKDLIPYRGNSLSRQERQTAAALRDAQLPAKRAAARINASALVAHAGLVNVEILTNLEVGMVKRGGAAVDARAAAIVNCYSGLVVTELARLSLGGE